VIAELIKQIPLGCEQADEYPKPNLGYPSTAFGNLTFPFCCTTL